MSVGTEWKSAMYTGFKWTTLTKRRNSILRKYEPVQPYLMRSLADVCRPKTFVDVGANTGFYTIFMASLPYVETVHAFEPSPVTYDELRRNIALNGLEGKVRLHKAGVSREASEVDFDIVSDLSGANSISGTSIHKGKAKARTIRIETRALDEVLHLIGETIFIKIDVEGHECEVLDGAERTLGNNEVLLQVEDYAANGGGGVARTMRDHGYTLVFQVGPDCYYSNIGLVAEQPVLLKSLQHSLSELIRENIADVGEPDAIRLDLRGPIASGLKRLKRLANR